jgi:hypothetical protein
LGSSLPKRMCAFLGCDGVSGASWDGSGDCLLEAVGVASSAFCLRPLDFFVEDVRSLALFALGVGDASPFFCVAGVAYTEPECWFGVWYTVSCVGVSASSASASSEPSRDSLATTTWGLERRRMANLPTCVGVWLRGIATSIVSEVSSADSGTSSTVGSGSCSTAFFFGVIFLCLFTAVGVSSASNSRFRPSSSRSCAASPTNPARASLCLVAW